MKFIRQVIVYLLVFMLPQIAIIEAAQATLIATDQFAAAGERASAQAKIKQLFSRPELARQLQALGVSPEQAQSRVEALTDQELAQIADQADRLPAGGDFFGTLGAIFIILLITDILGLTKVFPFTRAQR